VEENPDHSGGAAARSTAIGSAAIIEHLEYDQNMDGELVQRFDAIDRRFDAMEHRLVDKMRDMQTELLRAFAAASGGPGIRFRKM